MATFEVVQHPFVVVCGRLAINQSQSQLLLHVDCARGRAVGVSDALGVSDAVGVSLVFHGNLGSCVAPFVVVSGRGSLDKEQSYT